MSHLQTMSGPLLVLVLLAGGMIGALCGVVPLCVGYLRRARTIGYVGFLFSVGAGAFAGVVLAGAVSYLFTVCIFALRSRHAMVAARRRWVLFQAVTRSLLIGSLLVVALIVPFLSYRSDLYFWSPLKVESPIQRLLKPAMRVMPVPWSFNGPCEGRFKGLRPSREELRSVLEQHRLWIRSTLYKYPGPAGNQADLCEADLAYREDLRGALLRRARLSGVDLSGTDLTDTDLTQAQLHDSILINTIMLRSDLAQAVLDGADFEPLVTALPSAYVLKKSYTDLSTLTWAGTPAALVLIREEFKKLGLSEERTAITYAIKHTENHRKAFSALHSVPDKAEGMLSIILFESTVGYGKNPGRALRLVVCLLGICTVVYITALNHGTPTAAIWQSEDKQGPSEHLRLAGYQPKYDEHTWHKRVLVLLYSELRTLRVAAHFSLISAFQFGWREVNLGAWLSRLQPRAYTLYATGWLRTISGIQGLLSLYLVALWILSSFGSPFE